MGLPNLYIEDEGRNPTGTFKARGLAMAVSRAIELGVLRISLPSCGDKDRLQSHGELWNSECTADPTLEATLQNVLDVAVALTGVQYGGSGQFYPGRKSVGEWSDADRAGY